MADYYGLLARAVQALPRNEKSSRLEIYAKARHALIRQLKAINPPLPPEEISKQRLSLEEAIRRVEREAAEAAAAAMLSEEEIGRQAEQALEEALTSEGLYEDAYAAPDEPYADEPYVGDPYAGEPEEVGYEPPPRQPPRHEPQPTYRREPQPAAPQYRAEQRQPPRREPPPQRVQFEPPPRRAEPEVMSPRSAYADTGRADLRDEGYAEVVAPVRPEPAPRSAPPQQNWNRAATVTDVEEPTGTEARRQDRAARAKRGGRGWERLSHRKREKMSMRSRLAIIAVLLVAIAGAAYYVWSDWENVSTYVADLFGGGEPEEVVVVEEEIDPNTGQVIVFTEPTAVFYEEPGPDGISIRHEATVAWSLVPDAGPSAVVAAHIEVPERGIAFDLQIGESTNETASHEVSIVTTLGRNAEPIRGVDNISVKTTEEAIGLELEGEVTSTAGQYVLELPAANARVNTNRFATSPWFDIAFTYESGTRALVAFSKGTVASRMFSEAIATWAQ